MGVIKQEPVISREKVAGLPGASGGETKKTLPERALEGHDSGALLCRLLHERPAPLEGRKESPDGPLILPTAI